jgi:hypothetical protein
VIPYDHPAAIASELIKGAAGDSPRAAGVLSGQSLMRKFAFKICELIEDIAWRDREPDSVVRRIISLDRWRFPLIGQSRDGKQRQSQDYEASAQTNHSRQSSSSDADTV